MSNKKFTFTTVSMIIALLIFNSIALGFLISQNSFNHDASTQTQNEMLSILNGTKQLVDAQGNLSSQTRTVLLHQFVVIANHGGFATEDQAEANHKLLVQVLNILNESQIVSK